MDVTTLRLPKDLHEALEIEAQHRNESFAAYVRTILRQRDELALDETSNTDTEYETEEPNTQTEYNPNTHCDCRTRSSR